MRRCIVTYAAGSHEELLEVALPTYKDFAQRHKYDLHEGRPCERTASFPPAWNKIPLLLDALTVYEEVVWFDCDLIVIDPHEDFPPMPSHKLHSIVRHHEGGSEVPNSGVWRINRTAGDVFGKDLLNKIMCLEVFKEHGWWEQAALMTLMGYTVPPQGSDFPATKCRCVQKTKWYEVCEFMRLCWNSHPNFRARRPRVVHCSYPNIPQRLEVMRALVADPAYDYPRYDEKETQDQAESRGGPPGNCGLSG